MRIYPGNHPSLSVATAGTVHLAAAWAGSFCEGPFAFGVSGDLADDIVTEPLSPQGNLVPVPTGPGLGVTLDDEKVASLRIDK